jgi:hypothetical protein
MSRLGPLATVLTVALGAGLVAAGCQQPTNLSPAPSTIVVGSLAPGGFVPVVVNEEFAVGQNHFVFTTLDDENRPIAAPDRAATLTLTPASGGAPITASPVEFVWGIVGSVGYYTSDVQLPTAGTWNATIRLGAPTSSAAAGSSPGSAAAGSATVSFEVKAKSSAVAIGQPAPSTKTPTAADAGGDLKRISTDTKPDARFYQTSVDAALASHKPFVLVFATPAFCQSATCGPALDHVKALATAYPDLTFIHVEPYEMTFTDGRLQPTNGALTANAVTNAWGILTEPWVYVVDRQGVVKASFPSVFSDAEFTTAAKSVE